MFGWLSNRRQSWRCVALATNGADLLFLFYQVLRQIFPQFAQQGPRGGFMQQDAEELYSAVVNTLAQSLKEVGFHSHLLGMS